VGPLQVFGGVGDPVAGQAEPFPQRIKEPRGRGRRNQQVDFGHVHAQLTQEVAGRLLGAIGQTGLVTGFLVDD
jgi:hypothetical protein